MPRLLVRFRESEPRVLVPAIRTHIKKGTVYNGSMTKMLLKATLQLNGQNIYVPQVVNASSNGCVKRPQKNSFDHPCHPTSGRLLS